MALKLTCRHLHGISYEVHCPRCQSITTVKYRKSVKGQAAQQRYESSSKRQAALSRYNSSSKAKVARWRYLHTDKGALLRRQRERRRQLYAMRQKYLAQWATLERTIQQLQQEGP